MTYCMQCRGVFRHLVKLFSCKWGGLPVIWSLCLHEYQLNSVLYQQQQLQLCVSQQPGKIFTVCCGANMAHELWYLILLLSQDLQFIWSAVI